MTAPLQFRDVTLGYDRHPAVHHLNGEVASGALLAIVGPNGAGKSTLFRGIAGILKPLAGSILTGGLDLRDIAYLPQTVDIDRSFPISVFDLVGTGLWRSTGFFGGMGKSARGKIAQALAAVGLNGFENRRKRTVLAALHDLDLVRANFPETLLLARGPVAWGATAEVLTADNLLEARRMCEAFDDSAAACAVDDMPSQAA